MRMGPVIRVVILGLVFLLLGSFNNSRNKISVFVSYKEPNCHGCHQQLGRFLKNNNNIDRVTVIFTAKLRSTFEKRRTKLKAQSYFGKKKVSYVTKANISLPKVFYGASQSPYLAIKKQDSIILIPYDEMFIEGKFHPPSDYFNM